MMKAYSNANWWQAVGLDVVWHEAWTAPEPRDERTRELLREIATLHPEDPRAAIWAQV